MSVVFGCVGGGRLHFRLGLHVDPLVGVQAVAVPSIINDFKFKVTGCGYPARKEVEKYFKSKLYCRLFHKTLPKSGL